MTVAMSKGALRVGLVRFAPDLLLWPELTWTSLRNHSGRQHHLPLVARIVLTDMCTITYFPYKIQVVIYYIRRRITLPLTVTTRTEITSYSNS